MSLGHEAFFDRWVRNQGHAPDPHIGPYLERCTSLMRAGRASALEHDLSTEEERRTVPFFLETARPEKREWFAASFFSVDGGDWCMGFYRGDDPFAPEDATRVGKVGPYLARIVSLAQKFAAFDTASKLSALERVSSAALVLNATGRATQMNLPAQNLLGADFYLVRGRPAAQDRASNRRLQQLVSTALHLAPGAAQSYAPIVVDRDEAPWLLVEAMPVTAFGSDLFNSGRLILLLTDLRSAARPNSKHLCAAFGLTAAEAKLAARLASGVGIDTAATSVGVSSRNCPHPVESSVREDKHPPPSRIGRTPRASSIFRIMIFGRRGTPTPAGSGTRGECLSHPLRLSALRRHPRGSSKTNRRRR